MLKIRLARIGKKKKPTYRFIVSEAGRDMYGKALEIVGSYNPFSKVCDVKKGRILYWISQGAQPSPTVHNLLVDQNVITGDKVKASKGKKKNEESASAAPASTPAAAASADTAASVAPTTEVKPEEKPTENAETKAEKKKEEKAEEKTEEKAAEPAA
jgi:small subunit ribosomal protein S16